MDVIGAIPTVEQADVLLPERAKMARPMDGKGAPIPYL